MCRLTKRKGVYQSKHRPHFSLLLERCLCFVLVVQRRMWNHVVRFFTPFGGVNQQCDYQPPRHGVSGRQSPEWVLNAEDSQLISRLVTCLSCRSLVEMHFSELPLTVGSNGRIYFTLSVDSRGFPESSERVSLKRSLCLNSSKKAWNTWRLHMDATYRQVYVMHRQCWLVLFVSCRLLPLL